MGYWNVVMADEPETKPESRLSIPPATDAIDDDWLDDDDDEPTRAYTAVELPPAAATPPPADRPIRTVGPTFIPAK